jgi:hypothetical protein
MKKRRRKILALIPLNIDGELFGWQDGKADEMRRRLAANFADWERDNAKFDDQIERVARAMITDGGGREQLNNRLAARGSSHFLSENM